MNTSTKSESWSFPYCPNTSNLSIDWNSLEAEFDWLKSLADCPQDPRYHAEGNVLIHTKMVCEALVNLSQWQALLAREQSLLFAAALLHDVAKPVLTEIADDGAISSQGHVLQGAKMAQQILWDLNTPFVEREMIVALVKYGSLPLWFWDKSNPEKAVIKASQIICCDLLSLLAEADVRGRYCNDQAQLLERIEFFREFCQENQCFTQPRMFSSAHSRFIYFQKQDENPDYHAYDDTQFQVVMMSGLPGVGKDTWISKNLPDWEVISLDEIRKMRNIDPEDDQGVVVNEAKAMAKEYMRKKQNFIWNATNLSRQLREGLIRLFSSYQASIRIVYLETEWQELLHRNRNRVAKVPEKVLYKMRNHLEVPNITEAQEVELIKN
ncbi:MAG TPA: AAA family ATPase [Nostocaceae cyanobacterium]|nr:AAA family ATPase [Nostocaceae cyanobacterium]